MNHLPTTPVTPAPWDGLKRFTDARIALGRAGHSQTTAAHLAFQLAHAQARDAVHLPLDVATLSPELQALGLDVLALHSAAPDRTAYLQRPDWGRRLDAASRERLLLGRQAHPGAEPADLAFVVADGLSALGVMQNAGPLLAQLLQRLRADAQQRWTFAPLALVEQGRVAIGDEIGQLLNARCVVVLIGERPGLSSPDSLGVYFSWAPRVGLTDAQRNCISNVRNAGLPPERAAGKLLALLQQARLRQVTGIALKDDVDEQLPAPPSGPQSLRP
ncbi:MAG: ethanolamine ammonia-lyase subunit EutC [Hydrogenophaga sp.]|nr:ethanolamine ammonia-lyase subunit EutC [Hydrogenophaga sp.]